MKIKTVIKYKIHFAINKITFKAGKMCNYYIFK